jgi:hypothetical protein
MSRRYRAMNDGRRLGGGSADVHGVCDDRRNGNRCSDNPVLDGRLDAVSLQRDGLRRTQRERCRHSFGAEDTARQNDDCRSSAKNQDPRRRLGPRNSHAAPPISRQPLYGGISAASTRGLSTR